MEITEPQPPLLCASCAQRVRRASLRYCQDGDHQLMPACPQHGPMRITNAGWEAHCNRNVGRDSRGRMVWCQERRRAVSYDQDGHPLPHRDWPVRRIGRSVRKF